ncbi:MAG: glutaminyl-peptide cyclotransferase [Bacteroidetes bacterium]|nr:glutaminyl-peptide cyclotransferase [Bacteroidota bacterium]
MIKNITGIALIALFTACNSNATDSGSASNDRADNSNSMPVLNYTVVNAYPHDTTSYTEGFLVHDGQLYESTGHTDGVPSSKSLFGIVDLKTGKIDTKVHLDDKKYFGEGITFLDGKVFQMTLDTPKVCFVYDAKTFKKITQYDLNSEGWGMTTDGTYLIRSDGSSNLSYHDPKDFKLIKILGVSDNNGPMAMINELEYINGFIYANVYQTNYLVKIDPANGKVVARGDFTSLRDQQKLKYPDIDYFNGIAYDSTTKKIYITGKLWPNIFEIKLQ